MKAFNPENNQLIRRSSNLGLSSEDMIPGKGYQAIFAYGSNLNLERLKSRARNWDGRYKAAFLLNYELRFNLCVNISTEQARVGANVVPHPTRRVHGILVNLNQDDLFEIDKCEGHPKWYKRIKLHIELEDSSRVEAFAYVAQPLWIKEGVLPSADYLDHIVRGACSCGLPSDYIQAIYKLGKGLI
jgi:gamma-glutamylcyclotransferase